MWDEVFHSVVDEASRDKQVVALRTRDATVKFTAHYLDQLLREGLSINGIGGDGLGELGKSGLFS